MVVIVFGVMVSDPCIPLLDGQFVCMCGMLSCRQGTASGLLDGIRRHSLGTLV